jgi:hypothetical protein
MAEGANTSHIRQSRELHIDAVRCGCRKQIAGSRPMAAEHKQQTHDTAEDVRDEPRRPFEALDLAKFPRPPGDDPPYRPWWVMSDSQGR